MSITVQKRERPLSGMGSASPRYELHTSCCGIFLAADDSLETIQKAGSVQLSRGVDQSKLVIYDLGPKNLGTL